MPLTLQITGLQQAASGIEALAATLQPSVAEQVQSIFAAGANRARSACPVRTGRLKRSIKESEASSGSTLARIDITAPYAGFVNFGTRRQRPQPFATNAYTFILSELKRLNLGSQTHAVFG